MKFIKENLAYIIGVILLGIIFYLSYKVMSFVPVVIDNSKYDYLVKQKEVLQMDYNVAISEVKKYKELADAKPKEILVIKTKYVKIIDSLLSIPVTDKEQLLADRIYN